MGFFTCQLRPEPLSHATEDANDQLWPLLLQPFEFTKPPVDALLRILPHAARIYEDHVCLFESGGNGVSFVLKYAQDNFGICHIHLAAVRFNVNLLFLLYHW